MTGQNGSETLTTPKHDEMVLWSLNKHNILPHINFKNNKIKPSLILSLEYDEFKSVVKSNIFKNGYESLISDLQNKTHTKKYNETIELNWDTLNDDYGAIKSYINYISDNWDDFIKIESEVPVTARNGYVVGYLDIKVSMDDFEKKHGVFTLKYQFSQIDNNYIEIKPKIYSFGDTLRQIMKYQKHLKKGDFYLFTDDMKFKNAFVSQGIKVLNFKNM